LASLKLFDDATIRFHGSFLQLESDQRNSQAMNGKYDSGRRGQNFATPFSVRPIIHVAAAAPVKCHFGTTAGVLL